jgi:hypothetical protein
MLNTQLASWAEPRHNNVLYAKQSFTTGSLVSFPRCTWIRIQSSSTASKSLPIMPRPMVVTVDAGGAPRAFVGDRLLLSREGDFELPALSDEQWKTALLGGDAAHVPWMESLIAR